MNTVVSREIGSEFEWPSAFLNETASAFLPEGVRFFSGRTALYAVLRDALTHRMIRQAWLPSYCCASMIRPFSELSIPVRFYRVNRDGNGGVKREAFEPKADELVLSMAYFGFADEENGKLLRYARECGSLTIEDCTHSLLTADTRPDADYRIASLRKWFPVACGGWATAAGEFSPARISPPADIVELRKSAMQQKANYLRQGGDEANKQAYLTAYRQFNRCFDDPTAGYATDDWSDAILDRLDIPAVRERRRANAQVLLEGLAALPWLSTWRKSLSEADCPLFLPVVTPRAGELQAFLASKEIYCPMHWPQPCEQAASDLYKQELSLICDQRYDARDMQRLLDVLRQF